MFTFDENIVSDLHKEAYGFRPRGGFFILWNSASDERKQSIWDSLLVTAECNFNEEVESEKRNIASFEADIISNMEMGAASREDAIRWIVQGSIKSVHDLMYGGEQICHNLGLPFSMSVEFNSICEEMYKEFENE